MVALRWHQGICGNIRALVKGKRSFGEAVCLAVETVRCGGEVLSLKALEGSVVLLIKKKKKRENRKGKCFEGKG